MGRILAIDYGRKRTGIAVSDPLQIIATGLATMPTAEVMPFLLAYTKKENVEEFVVGYPRRMNNSPSETVEYIEPFIEKLKILFPDKKIVEADERFTSKMAVQAMIMAGARKKTRQDKALIDKISATIILQSYMEMKGSCGK